MENTPVNLPKLRRQIEDLLPPDTAFIMVIAPMYHKAHPSLVNNIPEDDAFELMRLLLEAKNTERSVELN